VRREAAKCRKGFVGTFIATAYIRTNGAVLTAGITPPNENAEEVADCIVDVIRRVRFVSPGNRIGKVTFEVP
jgi:hypothetical protein